MLHSFGYIERFQPRIGPGENFSMIEVKLLFRSKRIVNNDKKDSYRRQIGEC